LDILLLAILLFLSATFSSSETAFFALDAGDRSAMRRGGAASRNAVKLVEERANDLLSSILLGNLVVNIATGAVTTRLCLERFGPSGLAVAVPAATLLLLLFGEISPKLVALRSRRRLVLVLQGPLRLWVALTGPLVRHITSASEWLLRRLPWDRSGSRPFSTGELQTACELATTDGQLTETEGNFLARLLHLSDLEVRSVMTPRPDVVTLPRSLDRPAILEAIGRAGFNRFPVVEEEGAMPVGLFHTKDLLGEKTANPLQGSLRPLIYVPETKDVAAVLAEMRAGAGHLAVVVDEHGDFIGIVTMADCLQALIGRVGDSGSARSRTVSFGPDRWIIHGILDLRQFQEETGVEVPPSRDYVTIGGFVMARLGRIPQPGDKVEFGDIKLTVLSMHGRRLETLRVEREGDPS